MYDNHTDVWVGRQYGPYKITGLLGRGTVAHCYRATTPKGDEVGLKVLTPFAEARAEIRSLFEQEYELMARLDHPNVLAVHGAGVIGGAHFMEMEIVDGETLADRCASRRPPSLAEGIAVIQQICAALDHVHRHRIVHRDVKPSNIMLDARSDGAPSDDPQSSSPQSSSPDRAVLFDFGLAHDLDGPASPPGRVYGSPMYLSPEQALAQPVDARTDIYGLGTTLYALAVGSAPFYGERNDLLHAHVRTPPPDPAERGVPADLAQIILTAMAKAPDARYASGADFAAALASVEVPAPQDTRRRGLLRRLTSRT
ncbi:serine/threonine-protein kinase [Candidatus Poriferisodalis sp.]|uniref:serine/threonine-protein kinase n=1 Tax=Candidatus Poriferisodalis sp. TaxID=3101277 RepID=UPI003B024434